MNAEQDLTRIAEQLLRYIALSKPDNGPFANTDEIANNMLMALINSPTYVFDYSNLQASVNEWDGVEHLNRLATTSPTASNYLCRITFPEPSFVDHLLYLTAGNYNAEIAKHCSIFSHLTLPTLKTPVQAQVDASITPRCLGLHTIVVIDPDDGEVNVELCTTNAALQDEYANMGKDFNYGDMYHRTLFAMTYALENLLCKLKPHTFVLPKDDSDRAPTIEYHEVDILTQPANAAI